MGTRAAGTSVRWARRAALAFVIVFFFGSAGFLHAQGLGGLSQLFAGSGSQQGQGLGGLSQLLHGGGFKQSQDRGQSGNAVTVDRGATPYTGEFTAEEAASAGAPGFSGRFVCYPARDPIFVQTETFVCYAAQGPRRRRSADNGMNWQQGEMTGDQR